MKSFPVELNGDGERGHLLLFGTVADGCLTFFVLFVLVSRRPSTRRERLSPMPGNGPQTAMAVNM